MGGRVLLNSTKVWGVWGVCCEVLSGRFKTLISWSNHKLLSSVFFCIHPHFSVEKDFAKNKGGHRQFFGALVSRHCPSEEPNWGLTLENSMLSVITF